jgi:cysteinyl-tRNA synthetase
LLQREFVEDMEALGVQLPAAIGRVTEHVPQIIDLIQRLFQQGLAYEAELALHTHHTHALTHTHTHTCARAHT